MLEIVRLSLRRPYTVFVLAILILIFGPLATIRTPTDIFPDIKIPVIAVVWTYRGLPPDDMSGRVIYYYERQLSSSVNDIEHIESQSLPGVGIVKIFFQPGVDIRTATAQVTSLSQTVLKQMPPGITPPLILNYNASTVPILQLALSSPTTSEQQLFDMGQNFIRPALASVGGASVPSPYGGRERQIQIDIDPQALQSKGLSAQDVSNALAAQNQIIPAGTAKIGSYEYNIKLNNSPEALDALNDLPIKSVGGATVYIRDVAHVRDGYPPQRNEVRVDGHRSVLMSVLKSGSASTLSIVEGVKAVLPKLAVSLPPSLHIALLNDQSVFVRGAVASVVNEGVVAAALTSLMILLFLGSWRSTVIVATSIPLSVLSSLIALSVLGQTLNIMTLGGLALAVGILVDDATVTIENINWHLEQGKSVQAAIMEGAVQIVGPAFVSLLCISIAFVPMFTLTGISGFLFTPMAEAVVFALVASFILSRTLVPVMAMYLLKPHQSAHASFSLEDHAHGGQPSKSRNPLVRFQHGFEERFSRLRESYRALLCMALERRVRFVAGFLVFVILSMGLVPFLGTDFFPKVDSGQITLHVRAPVGTRLEDTAAEFDHVEQVIRRSIPAGEIRSVVDNIGLPVSGINRAYSNTGGVGPQDGDIYVALSESHHPTADYVRALRRDLPRQFPGSTFSFLPADIISQILNFGAPAPIDLQISGPNRVENEAYANLLLRRMRKVPGLADARLQQSSHYPQFNVAIDRTQANQLGLTERDLTNSLSTSLAGSFQTAPAFWLNPKNGVSYPIVAQTPEHQVASLSGLQSLPVTGGGGRAPQILGGLGTISRSEADAVVSHYAVQPSFDLYATTQGRDLGSVAADLTRLIADTAGDAPKGATVALRGQVVTMSAAFSGLIFGLLGAVVLIYLVTVVNFQSWIDPFVIITALPSALAGIAWMLFATGTTLSVPALTGAIMCMGVATANSILVVSFARERLAHSGNALTAAVEAGFSRFRPVLMTALAMIIGMAPMALGLGEGGEQNAPLGRAVIGGLIFATIATLFFVPVVFSLAHRAGALKPASDDPTDPELESSYA
jgi:multidrug efflux pump subunit AcrB